MLLCAAGWVASACSRSEPAASSARTTDTLAAPRSRLDTPVTDSMRAMEELRRRVMDSVRAVRAEQLRRQEHERARAAQAPRASAPGRVAKTDPQLLVLSERLAAPHCETNWRACVPPGLAIAGISDSTRGVIMAGDHTLSHDSSAYDVLVFRGSRRQNVVIRMEATFDAYLILLHRGRALADDDDSGGANHAEISVTLPADGWYLLVANSALPNGFGPYRISIRTDEEP